MLTPEQLASAAARWPLYPTVRALLQHIEEQARALTEKSEECSELREDLLQIFYDENGTAWSRPTAELYYRTCRALNMRTVEITRLTRELDAKTGECVRLREQVAEAVEVDKRLTHTLAEIEQQAARATDRALKAERELAEARAALGMVAYQLIPGDSVEAYNQVYWALVGDKMIPGDEQEKIMAAAIDTARLAAVKGETG